MNLEQWAIKWGVSYDALAELRRGMGVLPPDADAAPGGKSEAAIQAEIRLEASTKGHRLFRNNVGAGYMQDGSFIRFGLANDSPGMNRLVKSSDLIGIRKDGVFLAREIKAPGWRYTGTGREEAQLKFIKLIVSMGGDAAFATGKGTL